MQSIKATKNYRWGYVSVVLAALMWALSGSSAKFLFNSGITPFSRDAFKRISKSAGAVLNQAVFLKGVNDTRVKMWRLCETIQENYVNPDFSFGRLR
jgi:hypothetical protein